MIPVTITVDQKWVDELIKRVYKYEMFKDKSQKIWEFVYSTSEEAKKETLIKVEKPKKSSGKNLPKRTTTQCLKVSSLRKETGDKEITIEKWLENPKNVYVGRPGRVFIGTGDEKKIFHYKGSKFANPYKVGEGEGEYNLEESIKLYKKHLKDKGLIEKAKKELKGKNLGCFCDQKGSCHAKVLAEIADSI